MRSAGFFLELDARERWTAREAASIFAGMSVSSPPNCRTRRTARYFLTLGFAFVFATGAAALADPEVLRVQGSTAATAVVRAAAPMIKETIGVELKIFASGGSSQAIAAVGMEAIDVAVTTRALTPEDRADFPARRYEERRIATQTYALVVAPDVWEAGVRALSSEQMIEIFEGRIANWKAVGGPDRAIKFYRPASGPGAWEEFARWLYEEVRNAPLGKFEIVGSPEDARDSVEFNAGSMSLVPPKYADGRRLFALGIKLKDGKITQPVTADIDSGLYPLARPIFLVAGNQATGAVRKLFDFFLTPSGQEAVLQAGFFPVGAKTP